MQRTVRLHGIELPAGAGSVVDVARYRIDGHHRFRFGLHIAVIGRPERPFVFTGAHIESIEIADLVARIDIHRPGIGRKHRTSVGGTFVFGAVGLLPIHEIDDVRTDFDRDFPLARGSVDLRRQHDGLVARGLESRKDLVAREDRTVGESPRHVTRIGIGRPVEFERDGLVDSRRFRGDEVGDGLGRHGTDHVRFGRSLCIFGRQQEKPCLVVGEPFAPVGRLLLADLLRPDIARHILDVIGERIFLHEGRGCGPRECHIAVARIRNGEVRDRKTRRGRPARHGHGVGDQFAVNGLHIEIIGDAVGQFVYDIPACAAGAQRHGLRLLVGIEDDVIGRVPPVGNLPCEGHLFVAGRGRERLDLMSCGAGFGDIFCPARRGKRREARQDAYMNQFFHD